MTASASNPFAGLGTPPASGDPEGQLHYLRRVVDAFHQTGNPRLKTLRQRLDQALLELARGAERGADPDVLARGFAANVNQLQLQTFDLLTTVVNQARATLRVKLTQPLPPRERAEQEKLQKALGAFSQGLRKTLAAARKPDDAARDEANRLLTEAGQLMEDAGQELSRHG